MYPHKWNIIRFDMDTQDNIHTHLTTLNNVLYRGVYVTYFDNLLTPQSPST